jgi:two-component system CheB/CheR fusion protein
MERDHQIPTSGSSPGRAADAPETATDTAGFLVVGIGASAGGLEAFKRLLDSMPADAGMALILVQHLDPTHVSMMKELLVGHTTMTVQQASDGMPIAPDHCYLIPPGTYLSVSHGALRVSEPQARHGARLPFDYLLHSLADDYGPRAACVILSGTGADGSLGLKSVKENLGLVIAQEPEEAAFDGMPRCAIATGAVDLVLPVDRISQALGNYSRRRPLAPPPAIDAAPEQPKSWLPAIVEVLRMKTGHDFTLYKPGTLQRRIERRMAIASVEQVDGDRYIEMLLGGSGEIDLLAKDLFIHVTNFFRDSFVYEALAETILPGIVNNRAHDQPIRLWVAGCSTGEETYSLAMLFREALTEAGSGQKLQIFASDVDAEAIATAREGLYPETIAADVSQARLAKFFSKQDQRYRISPDLRGTVVFTVQDVLADPPFSRLDMISCRNLLIYLRPEAQAKVISLFHFALRPGGILLLGSSETVGLADSRFEPVVKSARIFRRTGLARLPDHDVMTGFGDSVRVPTRPPGVIAAPSRQGMLADLCRRMVLESFAPAAVLINRTQECLYSLGPTDRYLRVAPGHPTQDLMAMVREETRIKLRAAIDQVRVSKSRAVVTGARSSVAGQTHVFNIDVLPVPSESGDLLLVCFVDAPEPTPKTGPRRGTKSDQPIEQLQQELEATRAQLKETVRNLEISSEEQRAINEEALSVNEEYQSTNEELLTSKEELQSLNEELTALNGQLQETLERQRSTANDLQNVLFSTDVATIFLDQQLHIRFFTPASKTLFSILPTDIGRPLADLNGLTNDAALLADAARVLADLAPIELEIEAKTGAWFLRRIQPYRQKDDAVGGVVVTFVDITERRRAAEALLAAKRQAELANVAKSRFLAAASHDLRQPLQTMVLLQGALAASVQTDRQKYLVNLLDTTLESMTGMLDALLDINQIEAGTVQADIRPFRINPLLMRMRDEFTDIARAKGLELTVVACSLSIRSDPLLLEQMLRNLLSNAVKYTQKGKILLGCRRQGALLRIEIMDTGIGIPASEIGAIFEEYHQLNNPARERSRGLGLGLAIVKRLGLLLHHPVEVASVPGEGSVFMIDVGIEADAAPATARGTTAEQDVAPIHLHRTGTILLVEDDPEICELLRGQLTEDGHRVMIAKDGVAALAQVSRGRVRPDLLLADFNLPHGLDGVQLATTLRDRLHRQIPAIILTGDISIGTLRDIMQHSCVYMHKPVRARELLDTIQRLLPPQNQARTGSARPDSVADAALVFVVDDDAQVRTAIRVLLEEDGIRVEEYGSCEDFLAAYRPASQACLLIDAYLPGMDGLGLLQKLRDDGEHLPAVMITGNSDVGIAVEAMKSGAVDFIEKPVNAADLRASVKRALELSLDARKFLAVRQEAAAQLATLTPRQIEIMRRVLAGEPSKNIAADLGISQRTVENHRAAIMQKTGSKSLPALARLAVASETRGKDVPQSGD